MPALRRTIDFFELRPFFTLWALRAFWWIDIYVELDRLYNRKGALRLIAHFPDWAQTYNIVNLFLAPLTTWVSIATARLLLEVLIGFFPAAAAPRTGPRRYPGSAWQEFVAFIDLKPFFTRRWPQVFWWLYLLDALKLGRDRAAIVQMIGEKLAFSRSAALDSRAPTE